MSEQAYRDLQRLADRICSLILNSEYPAADIAVERLVLRREVSAFSLELPPYRPPRSFGWWRTFASAGSRWLNT